MKWKTAFKTAILQPIKIIWNSIFDNDAHKIVSRQGLIELMKHDKEAGLYDIDFNSTIEQPPSLHVVTVPNHIGYYCLGGNIGFCIAFAKKPNWFHRTMMKVCLGWEWKDKK